MIHFKPKALNVRIIVKDGIYPWSKELEKLEWLNMTLDFKIRWSWYFKYRAALLQVKYPKAQVERYDWQSNPEGKTAKQIENTRMKNRITTCKRMITKLSNKVKRYEDQQAALLIPNYEDKGYLRAKEKIVEYQQELDELLNKS